MRDASQTHSPSWTKALVPPVAGSLPALAGSQVSLGMALGWQSSLAHSYYLPLWGQPMCNDWSDVKVRSLAPCFSLGDLWRATPAPELSGESSAALPQPYCSFPSSLHSPTAISLPGMTPLGLRPAHVGLSACFPENFTDDTTLYIVVPVLSCHFAEIISPNVVSRPTM